MNKQEINRKKMQKKPFKLTIGFGWFVFALIMKFLYEKLPLFQIARSLCACYNRFVQRLTCL